MREPLTRPALACVLLLGFVTACSRHSEGSTVRRPVVAGTFYTADAERLREQVDHFLVEGAKKADIQGKPIALIAPHAGYSYSGRCAGVAYATVKGRSYRRVIVLAVNHRASRFRGGSILDVDAYETPLGKVPLDRKACATLLKGKYLATHRGAHRAEHSLEVQLPFLQRALGSFELVPVVVSDVRGDDFAPMAAELAKVVDDETLVAVSCDFTHYGRSFGFAPFRTDVRKSIEKLDRGAIDFALQRDVQGFWGYVQRTRATICGRCPVGVLLALLPEKATGKLLNYYTSGDATGDYSHSVSYAAVVFTAPGQWGRPQAASAATPDAAPEPAPGEDRAEDKEASTDVGVSEEGQRKLLEIARKTLVAVTAGKPVPDFDVEDKELQGRYGVFVTLNKNGQLRGCIGNFRPDTPLHRTVAVQTRMSALKDRRFRPVRADEVKDIEIEISVLLPEKKIDKPLDWEFGKHGIIVRYGWRSATFLPQVAEHFRKPGQSEEKCKIEMLRACCRKAGLPPGIFMEPGAAVLIYGAQVFGEKPQKSPE